jgi:hypothetical protein
VGGGCEGSRDMRDPGGGELCQSSWQQMLWSLGSFTDSQKTPEGPSMLVIDTNASLYYCKPQSLNPKFVLVTLLGIEERSQASSSTKSRQEVKKSSSLVHVTS